LRAHAVADHLAAVAEVAVELDLEVGPHRGIGGGVGEDAAADVGPATPWPAFDDDLEARADVVAEGGDTAVVVDRVEGLAVGARDAEVGDLRTDRVPR